MVQEDILIKFYRNMGIKKFIKGHLNFILLVAVQGFALFGLICAFISLFMSVLNSENTILWLLFFVIPLFAFVLWVWIKAIIPWTFVIIDNEHAKYLKYEKETGNLDNTR